ncbi:transmembrane protein, putative [Medicago truncatula]|uniref:Transmembrane protein, putative n=1 Tax=Medicago truncatula TaxID=3880 RepID=G7JJ55_MEDTR|nr:transmembrane protein, putative [Medicago truncatula]
MYTIEFAILFPSTSFIGWRLVHNRMSTDDQLHHRVTVLLKLVIWVLILALFRSLQCCIQISWKLIAINASKSHDLVTFTIVGSITLPLLYASSSPMSLAKVTLMLTSFLP